MERICHEPPLDPPEPVVVCSCSECGEPIYSGDRAIHLAGWGWICESCVDDLMLEVTEGENDETL